MTYSPPPPPRASNKHLQKTIHKVPLPFSSATCSTDPYYGIVTILSQEMKDISVCHNTAYNSPWHKQILQFFPSLLLVSKFLFGRPCQVSVLDLALWFSMIFCDCGFTSMILGKHFCFSLVCDLDTCLLLL